MRNFHGYVGKTEGFFQPVPILHPFTYHFWDILLSSRGNWSWNWLRQCFKDYPNIPNYCWIRFACITCDLFLFTSFHHIIHLLCWGSVRLFDSCHFKGIHQGLRSYFGPKVSRIHFSPSTCGRIFRKIHLLLIPGKRAMPMWDLWETSPFGSPPVLHFMTPPRKLLSDLIKRGKSPVVNVKVFYFFGLSVGIVSVKNFIF